MLFPAHEITKAYDLHPEVNRKKEFTLTFFL